MYHLSDTHTVKQVALVQYRT